MNQNHFSLGETARILKVQPYRIVYLLTTGKVPEPKLRLGNRRVFSLGDVQRISERLKVVLPGGLANTVEEESE